MFSLIFKHEKCYNCISKKDATEIRIEEERIDIKSIKVIECILFSFENIEIRYQCRYKYIRYSKGQKRNFLQDLCNRHLYMNKATHMPCKVHLNKQQQIIGQRLWATLNIY